MTRRSGSPLGDVVLVLVERELADLYNDLRLASASGMTKDVAKALHHLGEIREALLSMTGTEQLVGAVNRIIARYRDGIPDGQGIGSRTPGAEDD